MGRNGHLRHQRGGEVNGGCTVQVESSVDSTVVTDTSRQDPFQIDPEGSLSWVAASPAPITNHFWEIYVDVGGFPVIVASNDEAEPNTDEDIENTGDVADISGYVAEVSNYAGLELDGVFEVGGSIEGDGGACDGFGFVELTADPLTTLVSQIAAVVGLLALIGLLVLVFNRTREASVLPETVVDDDMAPDFDETDPAPRSNVPPPPPHPEEWWPRQPEEPTSARKTPSPCDPPAA